MSIGGPPGDELVIAEWDRATRSMWDGLQILKDIIDAGATIDSRKFRTGSKAAENGATPSPP